MGNRVKKVPVVQRQQRLTNMLHTEVGSNPNVWAVFSGDLFIGAIHEDEQGLGVFRAGGGVLVEWYPEVVEDLHKAIINFNKRPK